MRLNTFYMNLIKLKLLFMPRPKKLLFHHIPKCGGTTVNEYLKSQYLNNRIFQIDGKNPSKSIDYFKSLSEEKRYSYDLVTGHCAHQLRQYVHPEAIKTTIFRDPVDRIISHYFYVLRSPKHYLYREVTDKRLSLLDYATLDLSVELRNRYVCSLLEIPAEDAEKNPEKSILSAYEIIQKEYAVVGILENLSETMNKLAYSASFHNRFNHNKLNVTKARPKRMEVDQSVLRTIAQINHLDVRLFELIKEYVTNNS